MNQHISQLQPGDTLGGRYALQRVIGHGGMGRVFLADDRKIAGKRWAVKETLRYARDPRGFSEEAELLGRLDHPFLPKVVDFFPPDAFGFSYLVMDFVDGETLEARYAGKPIPDPGPIVRYAVQLGEVLGYLHRLEPTPIVYRDLKPSNVMIDRDDRIRLIDFGIARSFKQGEASDTIRLGTIGFASPEQFTDRQTDARTDLYSLGALLYFLLSGGRYYPSERVSLRRWNAGLHDNLYNVVDKLLQNEPEARY